MQQSVHFLTVATLDLDAARRFYADGLGWTPTLDVPDEIVFFQVAPGMVLGLFDADAFAADLGIGSPLVASPRGFTLSHNVDSPAEVDRLLDQAVAAGAQLVKPGGQAAFGGYHGYFSDPNDILWEIAHNPGWRIERDGTVALSAVEE